MKTEANFSNLCGPIVLFKEAGPCAPGEPEPSSTERYGKITGVFGDAICVSWRGKNHLFCRDSGECIESSQGEMRGFVISQMEMERFARAASARGARTPPQDVLPSN